MPLFEFRCHDCRNQFETLIRAAEPAECPACGSRQAEKLLSAPAAHVAAALPGAVSACPPADAPPCSPHCCRLQ